MITVIYGDVLLLIDFCMNCFALYITGIVMRKRIRTLFVVSAALIGAIYSVAEVFINRNNLLSLATTVAVLLLMCYTAFGTDKYIKTAAVFFCVYALLGGIMFAAYYLMGSYHNDIFSTNAGYAYSNIPLPLFAVLAAISLILSLIFAHIGRGASEKTEEEVTVTYCGKSASAKLLLDTGNLVKEPISGKNVALLNCNALLSLFEDRTKTAIKCGDGEYLLSKRFRLVCTSGAGGEKKVYYAFLPDKVTYREPSGKEGEMDVYVALSNDGNFGGLDGIVNPAVMAY